MSVYNNKPIGILLFEQFHGRSPNSIGSSRIRGHWLVKYWDKAEIFQQGAKYDVVIFQKVYWLDYVKIFKGIKILDICDPDYLDTVPVKEIIDNCDAVTTSTEALAEAVRQFTDKPVRCIPDRVDLETHNVQKKHQGRAKKVVWFGYSHNAETLDATISTLKRFGLKLKVISDFRPPYSKADENVKFENETFNKEVLDCDIVLLPKDTRPRGRFKSNNKTLIAWALGMPVATNFDELKRFLDPLERQKEVEKRLKEIRKKWDVKKSVEEFKNLIQEIKNGKRL